MQKYGPQLSFSVLVCTAIVTLACGSSPRLLKSVTVSPATADAHNYPSGLIPFTAAGIFSTMPSPVVPLKASWGVCLRTADSEQLTDAITVNSSGIAQCVSGASGTFTVWAAASSNSDGAQCQSITVCGGGCGRITGYAQITCP